MSVNEKMVQDIVQEVVAKMQISSDVSGKKGVFSDMNEAIEASKKAQKIVAKMSMDQREAIISKIREKIKENAEILARMGVEETGMGNVGHKILKHQLVAEKTPGTEDITTTAWSGDRGLTLIEMGPFGVIGRSPHVRTRVRQYSAIRSVCWQEEIQSYSIRIRQRSKHLFMQ